MRKRGWLLFGLFFILGLFLTLVIFRDELRQYLVEPLVYLIQYVQRTWMSLDPDALWGLFVITAYILILMSFPPMRRSRRTVDPFVVRASGGRLDFWITEVQQLHRQPTPTKYSLLELKKLTLAVVAFRQHCSLREAELWLEENAQNLPPEVCTLLHYQAAGPAPRSHHRLARWLRQWLSFDFVRSAPAALPAGRQVEVILQFLEGQMEVMHDSRTEVPHLNS